jgi:hypothetical protein
MVPLILGVATIGFRAGAPKLASDLRGIALQTVIVIVVLLAIAGAVAGVLLSRGGEAVAEAERQDITRAPSEFSDDGLCNAYGFYWSGDAATGTCLEAAPTTTTTRAANSYTVEVDCTNAGYTWSPPGDPNGICS